MTSRTAPSLARRAAPAALLGVAALVLSGCSGVSLGVSAGSDAQASAAKITVSPSPAKAVVPSSPLVVSVKAGRLTDVVVQGPAGPVAGSLSVDGRTWTSEQGVLDYGAKYSVSAKAVDRTGLPTQVKQVLKTVAPTTFLGMTVTPAQGAVVGVGMPITVDLDRHLSNDAAKKAFESHAVVTVNGQKVEGGWRWLTDQVVEYRPATYWPGHAKITLSTNLKGVKVMSGLWGKDSTVSFSTAAAMVSYVDMNTDQMKVTRDGKTIRVIPITTGKPGFETRSGVKVIMNKERTRIMDAATGGTNPNDPEYYRLEVEYAMRLTYSGEFLHAAPWSVAHQGHSNVSHGCTGMSTSNAAWLYANSTIGDVVVYSAGHREMEQSNGIGVWNVSWSRWQQYSALT
ncbi:MAG: Ig-like domain-containing protein [Candidatus Nanopelagicales bacterium]